MIQSNIPKNLVIGRYERHLSVEKTKTDLSFSDIF